MIFSFIKRKSFVDIAVLLAGASLAFAFAPFQLSIIPFFSCAFLLFSWINCSPKQAAWRGFLFGLGQFGAGVSWVYISIQVYGQAPPLLAGFITLVFISYLALFPCLQGYFLNRFAVFNNTFKYICAFPTSWVLNELLRSWLFTGFPWLLLGYSQTNSYLSGYAPLFGVYGISFLIVFCSGFIVNFFITNNLKKKYQYLSLIGVVLLGGVLLKDIPWTKKLGDPIKTAVIQGNIKQELKWQPDEFAKSFKLYLAYTYSNLNSDLIVWPEAAITLPLYYVQKELDHLSEFASKNHVGIITGVPIVKDKSAYNGIVALGDSSGSYYKRHLVPFGEYTPLKIVFNKIISYFNIPMSNFIPGPKSQRNIKFRGLNVAPYICYEVAYPLEFLSFLPAANILLTITDDSWFGKSIASAQHLQMAQMRTLETGRPLIFSSNTGITGVIDHKGKLIRTIPAFEEQVLTAKLQPMEGSTPWTRWHLYPLLFLMVIIASKCLKSRKN